MNNIDQFIKAVVKAWPLISECFLAGTIIFFGSLMLSGLMQYLVH